MLSKSWIKPSASQCSLGQFQSLTEVPFMIPVVVIKNFRPLVCIDIHLNAEISVYVHPPRKKTTVVMVRSGMAEGVSAALSFRIISKLSRLSPSLGICRVSDGS